MRYEIELERATDEPSEVNFSICAPNHVSKLLNVSSPVRQGCHSDWSSWNTRDTTDIGSRLYIDPRFNSHPFSVAIYAILANEIPSISL